MRIANKLQAAIAEWCDECRKWGKLQAKSEAELQRIMAEVFWSTAVYESICDELERHLKERRRSE